MKDHPEMSERFMAFLLLRNSQIQVDHVDQLFNSSEKRLALLIILAQVSRKRNCEPSRRRSARR